MQKGFSKRKLIVVLSLVLVYSSAICYISVLAKKAVIGDIVFPKNLTTVLYAAEDSSVKDSPAPSGSQPVPISKAELGSYGMFSPVTTQITGLDSEQPGSIASAAPSVLTQPETAGASQTVSSPQLESVAPETTQENKPDETEKKPEEDSWESDDGSKAAQSDEDTADEGSEKEDDGATEPSQEDELSDGEEAVELDDTEESVELSDTEESVELTEDTGGNLSGEVILPEISWDYGSLWQEEYFGYPQDVLQNGKSYYDDTVTIYDKSSGRYLTGNAFDIVCQVTFNEIGSSRHEEAIKAQAVAVYTYIKHYQQKGEYASLSCKQNVPQNVIECVKAVDGLAMMYDGEYIMAAFSASTAGVTCSSENVWGGERPYLKSVVSQYDYLDTKNYGRITTYTAEEVKKKIESKTNITLSGDPSRWFQILSYGDGGYVDKIAIDGHTTARVSGDEKELTAHVLRTYILSIRSACFTVSYSDGVFTFVTYGYGHGVGMSQIGADLYAEYGGYTFDRILHHYYTGITIC